MRSIKMNDVRKYQNEKPVESDLFGGKGHQQVADAIAKVLLSDNSQHIIGIEGNLGAGKSTVINILKKTITDNGFHVVTFDADQYHTTLKPALIQTIESELKTLLGKKDQHLAKLQKAVEIALGKRFEYTKGTTSHISFLAIVFAFSLGVSALQLKPTLKFFFDLFSKVSDLDKVSGFISLSLFLSPVVLFFIIKIFGEKTQLGDLVKRNSTDTISETIDVAKEVGAIELRDAFKTFAGLIPKEKTLLLVIDNIDRVSPELARELWSDIEILTSLGCEQFRILLPYSEEHLAKALEKSSVDESQSGKEFITKRIPIPFSAPPIVTAGWRHQFEKYWEQTLPDIDGLEGVKDLIDIWVPKVTPRYLKSLVNRIGAKIDSCPESNEVLDGASCAAYIMSVRDRKLSINTLLSDPEQIDSNGTMEEFALESNLLRKLKATHRVLRKYSGSKDVWSKKVAALHYQTSFDVAQSELLIEPIKTAMNTYDASSLLSLSSLLGFDVFFKQQIESTDASDLVKISDTIVQEESGKELLINFIKDINHEIKCFPDSEYIFDEELLDCYDNLKANDIDIDLKLAKDNQNKVTQKTSELWNEKYSVILTGSGEDTESDWAELEELVRQSYAHYNVTKILPSFIRDPEPEFVVNALFLLSDEIQEWNISELISKQNLQRLVISACQRQKLFDDMSPIFREILKQKKVGDLKEINIDDLLTGVSAQSDKLEVLLDILPFSNAWYGTDSKGLGEKLANRLVDNNETESLTENSLELLVSLCIAAFIHKHQPSSNIYIKGVTYTSSDWLKSRLEKHTYSEDYLTDLLSACSFSSIMTWCKCTSVGHIILPALERLIETDRVYGMDINDLLASNYVYLKENFSDFTQKNILDWMDRWSRFSNDAMSWSIDVIDDILIEKPNALYKKLIEFFDNEDLTSEDWLDRIEQNHIVIAKLAMHYKTIGEYLNYPRALQNSLKSIPKEFSDCDPDLIDVLTSIIDKKQQNGIRMTLRSNFLKSDTSTDYRFRAMQYFGKILKLPDVSGDIMEQEITTLIDEAISDENQYALSWLLSQPINGSGWNIENWSINGLEGLHNVLKNAPEAEEFELYIEIEKRLKTTNKEASVESEGII